MKEEHTKKIMIGMREEGKELTFENYDEGLDEKNDDGEGVEVESEKIVESESEKAEQVQNLEKGEEIGHVANRVVDHATYLVVDHIVDDPFVDRSTDRAVDHVADLVIDPIADPYTDLVANINVKQVTNFVVDHGANPYVDHAADPSVENFANLSINSDPSVYVAEPFVKKRAMTKARKHRRKAIRRSLSKRPKKKSKHISEPYTDLDHHIAKRKRRKVYETRREDEYRMVDERFFDKVVPSDAWLGDERLIEAEKGEEGHRNPNLASEGEKGDLGSTGVQSLVLSKANRVSGHEATTSGLELEVHKA
ncbi:hypothetical protein PHJA_000256300 [Phtheirospermum japonicum]|uniref:Uncharacterized protein n=1 Tax=Phtheirospermum japonicum TaxID=374723 RepID=A0A830B0U2_9LAMI|nr:hypothetical protein PHJA_000256300 [Phtheirospermum japonicum]